MLDMLFSNVIAVTGLTLTSFLVCIGTALVLGLIFGLAYTFRTYHTNSFVLTLALLPGVVCVVIMLVSGNLGAGVAVAGTFSLVRFRSAPGTAKEICAVFVTMAIGLACGMGYPGFAAIFAIIMCVVYILYTLSGLGGKKQTVLHKELRITVPEDLDYEGVFADILAQYTSEAQLVAVKTTNLGSLNKLTYDIVLLQTGKEKELIDALRCRNGNLEISLSVQPMDSRDL